VLPKDFADSFIAAPIAIAQASQLDKPHWAGILGQQQAGSSKYSRLKSFGVDLDQSHLGWVDLESRKFRIHGYDPYGNRRLITERVDFDTVLIGQLTRQAGRRASVTDSHRANLDVGKRIERGVLA